MVAEQVIQVIEAIAQQLGVAVEKVYPMLLGQTKVVISSYHVTIGVAVVAFVLLIIGAIGFIIADDAYSEVGTVLSIVCIIVGGITFMISGIDLMFEFRDYLTAIHNPDWWAIEYVTKLLT